MSTARLVITSVTVQQLPVAQVAATYGVTRSWIYELLARYRIEGEAAFEPRSRRPRTSPTAAPASTVQLIETLRADLAGQGLDAGADSIRWHLVHHQLHLSRATVHRVLVRSGLVTPQPKKRPRSSYLRFAAEQPNQCWQADFTHYRLDGGGDVEFTMGNRPRKGRLRRIVDRCIVGKMTLMKPFKKLLVGGLLALSLAGAGAVATAPTAEASKSSVVTTYFTGSDSLGSCNSTATSLHNNGYVIWRSCYAVKSNGGGYVYALQYYRP